MNRTPRRLLYFLAPLFVLALVYFAGFKFYAQRPRTVTITYAHPAPLLVEIYRADGEGGYVGSPLSTVSGTQTLKLKPGIYVAVNKTASEYEQIEDGFTVTSAGADVTIKPVFSRSTLERMLSEERVGIIQAVSERLPGYGSDYQVTDVDLHYRGEWASVVITLTGLKDYFHLVLAKENNAWRVRTRPAIVLSSPEYPNIPREILVEVNKNQYSELQTRD